MSDVLAIGPHPDDVDLFIGGTVAMLARAGHAVTLLDLTEGERATRGTPAERAQEASKAAAGLGVTREGLHLPDGGLNARDPAQLDALVAAIRRHRPRLLLTLSGEDDHPDHREGAELVTRAAYWSGVRNYPDPTQPGDPHRPARVLYGMGRRSFSPSLVVDVSEVYDAKRAAIAAFRSQFFRESGDTRVTPISDPGFLPRLEARDRYFGGMIGAEYGEPFFEEGPVPVRARDLLPGEARR